jgi:hypothetical protein
MSSSWRRLARTWRAWRRHVRRDRAAVAFLALLSLGLFEPLLCILHCQLWMPSAAEGYSASHEHHQHHMHRAGASATLAPAPEANVAIGLPAVLPDGCSFHLGPQSGSPEQPLPLAFHEMFLPLPLLAALILFLAMQPSAPPAGPPRVFIPVPLRPPIPFAA